MIQKMTKITLLFLSPEREKVLKELQELGIVHLEQEQTEVSDEIISLEEEMNKLINAGRFLKQQVGESELSEEPQPYGGTVRSLVGKIERAKSSLDKANDRIKMKREELESVRSHGHLSAEFRKSLLDSGFGVESYIDDKKRVDSIAETIGEDVEFIEIFEDKEKKGFLLIYPQDNRPEINALPLILSEKSSSELEEELNKISESAMSLHSDIKDLAQYQGFLEKETTERRNHLSLMFAEMGTTEAADGEVSVVTGWVPSEDSEKLESYLSGQEVVYYLEKPSPEEVPPIKLKNSRFASLFEPIMRIFSLPNYQEIDPTPWFAPFYMLFFGLCVADLGFGLLLFIAVLAALVLIKKKSMKQLIYLGLFLSISVMLGGLFLDDVFGYHLTELLPHGSVLQKAVLFKTQNDAEHLAIMLGFIQVILGYILKVSIQVRKNGLAGAGKPLGVILILFGVILIILKLLETPDFAIGPFPFGKLILVIPSILYVGLGLFGLGVLLILFLGSLEHKIYIRPLVGLWELYELATGLFGDILSYLRLFALGLAGGLLSITFNNIALMVRGNTLFGIIPFVLVLLLGSALNLGIGLLSAFVHSLRLTFVEFYKAVGFKGGGKEYSPLNLK